jgi:hypothetical protein
MSIIFNLLVEGANFTTIWKNAKTFIFPILIDILSV